MSQLTLDVKGVKDGSSVSDCRFDSKNKRVKGKRLTRSDTGQG